MSRQPGTGPRLARPVPAALVTLALLTAPPALASFAFTPRFDTLGLDHGLSQGNVNAVIQDPMGFMWFGTQDGLNRFDGYTIRVYRHDPADPHSLGADFINALVIDHKNALWIGSRGGLHRFDPALERFADFPIEDPEDPDLRDRTVTALARAPDGALWVGTQRGRVARMFPDRDRLHWFDLPTGGGAIQSLFVDTDRSLWISNDAGLHRLDHQHEIEVIDAHPGFQRVSMVYRDSQRRLWLGADQGLGWIDDDERFHWLTEDLNSRVTAIWEDRENDLWVGTQTNGLFRYRADLARVGHYASREGIGTALPSNEILSLYEDRTGVIWIGTRVEGVSRFDRTDERFGHIYGDAPDNGVYAIEPLADQAILLGTRGGLVRLDLASGTLARYRHDSALVSSVSHDWILSIARDSRDRIWVGTFGGGLNQFDLEHGTFKRYPVNPDDPSALGSALVARIHEHDQGLLWLATNAGIEVFDPDRGQVVKRYRHDPQDPGSLSDNQVRALYFDARNRLWAGTRGNGLNIIDLATGTIDHLTSQPSDPNTLTSNFILSIQADSRNRLWVSTVEGLNQLDPATGRTLARYNVANGLPNEFVYGVVEDDAGRLWLSTNRGLSRFDPETRVFRNYDVHDGLQGNEYNLGAFGRTADGRLFFGGANGINLFHPSQEVPQAEPARPVITDVLLFNETIGHQGVRQDSPLATHPSLATRLTLGYQDSVVTFAFSALHFADPDHNRFSYRMSGLDDRWIFTDSSQRFATFTSLDPGRYQFQLRAAPKNGTWNDVPVSIDVQVTPPPWRSGAAYAAYVVLAALMALAAIRIHRGQQAQRERVQRAVAESEERLRLSLWASGDVLWDWDLRGGLMRRFNLGEGAADEESEAARSIDDYASRMHPEDFDRVRQAFNAHMTGETPYFEATYRRQGADGWMWILDRGQVVKRDRDGQVIRMAGTMKDVTALKETEAALRRLNDELESRVDGRTKELRKANDDLLETLRQLREAQGQLVESEKMASLGSLVAGVAHEINTPLGISVTAASHLNDATRRFLQARQAGEISDQVMNDYEKAAGQGSQLILDNLRRAARLVSSFKQVAVDQSDEKRRPFNLREYMDEILLSLHPKLRRSPHQIRVDCPPDLTLVSFPGAFYQIISNLVINSLAHGFANVEKGHIDIVVQCEGDDVRLTYRDDGCGMPTDVTRRIFEPFFTTRRGDGGSGLGMHIVYNLVTQGLQGTIRCSSAPGAGVTFTMRFPMQPDLGRTGEMPALSGLVNPEKQTDDARDPS